MVPKSDAAHRKRTMQNTYKGQSLSLLYLNQLHCVDLSLLTLSPSDDAEISPVSESFIHEGTHVSEKQIICTITNSSKCCKDEVKTNELPITQIS
jgi:hypothetical protein